MALSDELKTLQELHENGKLTDQEYTDAKAATLKRQSLPPATRASFLTWSVKAGLALLLLLIGWVWYNVGTRTTTQLIQTAVHAPITLEDEIENIPASSWKAVALSLPYGGSVDVNLQVVRGNPVDVFLTKSNQLETMKKEDWSNVRAYVDFNATKTKTYKRTGQLQQGNYYLVMRDTSLGILSSSASDISVKVQLNP